VPAGIALVVHDAADEERLTDPHVPAVAYVIPSVEYSKFTVPVAPEVTVTLMVTDPPAACDVAGVTLEMVVVLAVDAPAGAANIAPSPMMSNAVAPAVEKRRTNLL